MPQSSGGGGLETTSGAREEATARGGGGAASTQARREARPARGRLGLAPAEGDEDVEKARAKANGAASISSGACPPAERSEETRGLALAAK